MPGLQHDARIANRRRHKVRLGAPFFMSSPLARSSGASLALQTRLCQTADASACSIFRCEAGKVVVPFALAAVAQGAQLLPDAIVNGEGLAVHRFLRDGDAVFVYAVAHPLEREAADGFEAAGEVLPLPLSCTRFTSRVKSVLCQLLRYSTSSR